MNFQKQFKFDKKKDPELLTPTGDNPPTPPAPAPKFEIPPINVQVDNSEIGKEISKGFKELGQMLAPKSPEPKPDPAPAPAPTPEPKPEPKSRSIMDDFSDVFGNW